MRFRHTLKALKDYIFNLAVVSFAYAVFGEKTYGYFFMAVLTVAGLLISAWEDNHG